MGPAALSEFPLVHGGLNKWGGIKKELGGGEEETSHIYLFFNRAKHNAVSLSVAVGNELPPTQTNTLLSHYKQAKRLKADKAKSSSFLTLIDHVSMTTRHRKETSVWALDKRQIYSRK